jgi:phosphate transport system substrate-binding protein
VNAPGDQSYPIATYTYILIYKDMSAQPNMNKAKAEALAKFLWWAIHDGQKYAPTLLYAPLPKSLVARVEGTLKSVSSRGAPVLP